MLASPSYFAKTTIVIVLIRTTTRQEHKKYCGLQDKSFSEIFQKIHIDSLELFLLQGRVSYHLRLCSDNTVSCHALSLVSARQHESLLGDSTV